MSHAFPLLLNELVLFLCRLRGRCRNLLVTLAAVTGGCKGILAVMAGTAGLSFHHGTHAVMLRAMFVRENFGVTIGALVHPEVELVIEDRGTDCAFGECEGHGAGVVTGVALGAFAGNGEGVLAVVTGAAALAAFHGGHRGLERRGLEGEVLRVAGIALEIHPEMDLVTEYGRCGFLTGNGEGDFLRVHPLVASAAVGCYGKRSLAVVADTALLALLHLGHGDVVLAGNDGLAIVAALTLAAGLCDMN